MPHSISKRTRTLGQSTRKQWESMLGQKLTYMGTGMEPEGHGRGRGNGEKQMGKPWEYQSCFVLTDLGARDKGRRVELTRRERTPGAPMGCSPLHSLAELLTLV
ncbi:rCG31033 [Rattus norvegicus]|uniref:RCG31033 n=1 Tax=Rattus norvegicus TaxID=10116 RepID=A6IUD9_RAT|nr:rCG31033 [Rattus norvegicus]